MDDGAWFQVYDANLGGRLLFAIAIFFLGLIRALHCCCGYWDAMAVHAWQLHKFPNVKCWEWELGFKTSCIATSLPPPLRNSYLVVERRRQYWLVVGLVLCYETMRYELDKSIRQAQPLSLSLL